MPALVEPDRGAGGAKEGVHRVTQRIEIRVQRRRDHVGVGEHETPDVAVELDFAHGGGQRGVPGQGRN